MRYVCSVCGYSSMGERPDTCPVCEGEGAEFYIRGDDSAALAEVHMMAAAQDAEPAVVSELRAAYEDATKQLGQFMAISRQADREGYPEVASACERIAREKGNQAARLAELLGIAGLTDTKGNLTAQLQNLQKAASQKGEAAQKAKDMNYDAIHDAVHEMARDDARFVAMVEGLLKRYF
ncbi:MAG: NADH peroxidase [Clostridiales bacterium]|nr:NADH peroxidase [Clostridiales bacterium]